MNAQIELGLVIDDKLITPADIKAKDAQIERLLGLLDKAQEMIRNRRETLDATKRFYQSKVDRLTHDALYWKAQYDRMVGEYEKI